MGLEWFEWNPFMFEKLTPLIGENWIFADVGANLGEFTDFFKKFKYSKIYAFELCPETASLLEKKYKNEPNIVVENCAVCDLDGEVPYYEGTSHTCHNILGHDTSFKQNRLLGKMKAKKLDSILNDRHVDLMKIDVEGAELLVLNGMKGIMRNIDNILIECHLDRDWPEIKNLLLDSGLSCVNFYDGTVITRESPRPYQCFCRRSTPSKMVMPSAFILDVDGVLTNGQFLYTSEGKIMKIFGPDDNDGLSILKPYLKIHFVTGDKKGFEISRKRVVEDMGYPLDLVSTVKRVEWIAERYPLRDVIYMGDGILDHYVMKKVGYSIAPANADRLAIQHADYTTKRTGGDRAVAEACLHILCKFFGFDQNSPLDERLKLSGEWAA